MMHTREKRGPSGEMELSFEHSESGSGHRDDRKTVTLKAVGGKVVLAESLVSSNAMKLGEPPDRSSDEVEIEAVELIDLIKSNGRKI